MLFLRYFGPFKPSLSTEFSLQSLRLAQSFISHTFEAHFKESKDKTTNNIRAMWIWRVFIYDFPAMHS